MSVEYVTTLGAGNWSLIRTGKLDALFMWCINICNLTKQMVLNPIPGQIFFIRPQPPKKIIYGVFGVEYVILFATLCSKTMILLQTHYIPFWRTDSHGDKQQNLRMNIAATVKL